MTKMRYFVILFIGILMNLTSCSSEKEGDEPNISEKELTISTTILTRSVRTEFQQGDALSVFIKAEASTSGKDIETGIKATYSGTWALSPNVKISSVSDAFVYAFYPYSPANTNANAVPVKVSDQVDYLYSGTPSTVSYASPQANLVMKHALDIIAFNILSDGYPGTGRLTSVTLNGDGFATEGTLDVGSGKITATAKGGYTLTGDYAISAGGWSEDMPQVFALPISSTGKNVNIIMTIDGKEYSIFLPMVAINEGMKYIFRLALTANGLSIFSDHIEVISLNKAGSVFTLGKYGAIAITYSGTKAVLPELSGSNVLGTVYWNNNGNQESYSSGASFTYPVSGSHDVRLDTWGADKISFADLTNIEEIDLSSFKSE
ncbi:MAG: fimbrillin family protein [Bacteroides sp.]|nr:fimbrillin family protein [Bacteroides sp.]